jgi:hypothetical protein
MGDNVERLIIDFKESLEREIHALGGKMSSQFEEMITRFDTQAARLDKQLAAADRYLKPRRDR